MDSFVCAACDKTWERKPTRGRVPKLCPECRALGASKRLSECAWCGRRTFIRRDATCCSRLCGNGIRAMSGNGFHLQCELDWNSCLVCLRWFTQEPRLHGTCSTACRAIATEVLAPRQPAWESAERECPMCGLAFIPAMPHSTYCGPRCQKKGQRQRRRVREAGTFGEWRWSDFMRVARKFGYCCAYCGMKSDRLDPDHVVPLSKSGHNVVSNLLPACPACNSDKRDLLLHEWEADRARRGLSPRCTSWSDADPRYYHLTFVRSALAAA